MPHLVSAAVMLLCFFLPIAESGGVSYSPVGMAFGMQASGYTISDPTNFLFIAPAAAALVALLALKGKIGDILGMVFGAINLILVAALVVYTITTTGFSVNFSVGLYLYVISSIALIVFSVIALVKPKQPALGNAIQ